jgi:hypothetical protein
VSAVGLAATAGFAVHAAGVFTAVALLGGRLGGSHLTSLAQWPTLTGLAVVTTILVSLRCARFGDDERRATWPRPSVWLVPPC